ncbi:MAG: alpha/beta fold hydrolase [Ktedonobacteraceae bacterium]|nr:alpha/beta fold hydrolase [Ktedonobacteraceae bacterium]
MMSGEEPPIIQRQPEREMKQPRVGVLLVHGLNGSHQDMEELAIFLTQHGMVTENMLLPGHGTHVRDLLSLGWTDWSTAVQVETKRLKQRCDLVFLIGHSLGGALCLHTAAHEQVHGIVSMCAPLHMFFWTRPAVQLAMRFTPVLPTVREDVRDGKARKRYTRNVYRWTPMRPVNSMLDFLPTLRREIPRISAPVLVMNAIRDHVVPASDGFEIYRIIGSHDKELLTLHRSYHVIMLDHDRDEVFARTLSFLKRQIAQYHDITEQTA